MTPKKECLHYVRPVRDVLELLAGKWKVPLLISLATEGKRFNELERILEGITPRTLSKELKELEMHELVQRIAHDTVPATVEYRLTAYGNTFEDVIVTLRNWGLKHRARFFNESAAEPVPFRCQNAVAGTAEQPVAGISLAAEK
jgi:DNA-binding HxlR family transcriptional regulator